MTFEHSPLLKALRSHAISSPEKDFLISTDGERYSYARTMELVLKAVNFLYRQGLRKGNHLMLSAEKDPEFVFFYLAAQAIDVVNVVVDAKLDPDTLAFIKCETSPVLTIGLEFEDVPSAAYSNINLEAESLCDLSENDYTETDTADIMFTSGTTGRPKGVVLTHSNIFASASNINRFIGNGSDDRELLGLPICHSFGLGRIRCNILAGGTVVLHNGFANLKSVFKTIEDHNITGLGFVPAVWAYIKRFSGSRISRYASQIRYIEIGSAAMPVEDKEMLSTIFPDTRICMHFGLTEASRSLFMEFHSDKDHIDSLGKPVADCVKVMVCDHYGNPVPDGTEGEICISGPTVTRSYLRPSDNEQAFTPQGYFRTGDWGCRDNEGYYHLVSRIKELINVGGKKVSPVEIENALTSVGVGESMVISIPDPDGILGEVPKALLVKGTFTAGIDTIKQQLSQILPQYKMPRFFELADSIPQTPSGKKKRTSQCQN